MTFKAIHETLKLSKKFDNIPMNIALEKNIRDLAGFSEKKAKLYLTLLELGEASVADIAAHSKLKRTTVYSILPELQEEGLVSMLKKKGKKTFLIEDPRYLKNSLEEKAKLIEAVIPQLQALHNVFPYKPRITTYEGLGGMKDIYRDVIKSVSPGDVILSYIGTADFENVFPEEIGNYYIEQRIKKKVINRIMTIDSKKACEWQKSAVRELREIKIIDDCQHSFSGDLKIFGNKVAFLSYKENFMGMIIESREISHMHRSWFEKLWELLS